MQECRLNRVCTKKPVGLLIAWLRVGGDCKDRAEHKHAVNLLSPAAQRAARRWAEGQASLRPVLEFEAQCLGELCGAVQEPL